MGVEWNPVLSRGSDGPDAATPLGRLSAPPGESGESRLVLDTTIAISLSRNIASYWPRPRSQAPMSMLTLPPPQAQQKMVGPDPSVPGADRD
jgi:hypothetical protein